MNIGEHLLAILALYGLPVLFVSVLAGSAGLPLPLALLLIASGSFIAQGQMHESAVIAVGVIAAVAGDQIGYALGRWGRDKALEHRRSATKVGRQLQQASLFTERWGGAGVFFSRWLVTPLGPWVNVICGVTRYPWPLFLVWDIAGELLWVVVYVSLGRLIAGRVQAVDALAGDVSWIIAALAAAGLLAWAVQRNRKRRSAAEFSGSAL